MSSFRLARTLPAEDSTVYEELEENDGAACSDEAGDIHEADDEEATAVDEAMDRRLVSGDSSSALVPELDRSSDGVVAASVVGIGSSEGEWRQHAAAEGFGIFSVGRSFGPHVIVFFVFEALFHCFHVFPFLTKKSIFTASSCW